MHRRNSITKNLAVAGSVFVWLPIAIAVVMSILGSVTDGRFRFYFLLPAELFPVELIGGGLVLWSAQRAGLHQKLASRSAISAIYLLLNGLGVAVATGITAGKVAAAGWVWALIIALVGAYSLAVMAMGFAGILIIRDLSQCSVLESTEHPSL